MRSDGHYTGLEFEHGSLYPFTRNGMILQLYVGKVTPPCIEGIQIYGHRPSLSADVLMEVLDEAFDILGELDADACVKIFEWTSLIIELEKEEGYAGTLLTSSTFPKLPFCTLITRKSLRHIPPNNVSDVPSIYCLAENLYHEALHQELCAELLHRDVFHHGYDSRDCPLIEVPWRGTSWEPDRVLHAIYVYKNVSSLRLKFLESPRLKSGERNFILEGLSSGRGALEHLRSKLIQYGDLFTDHGKMVLQHITSD